MNLIRENLFAGKRFANAFQYLVVCSSVALFALPSFCSVYSGSWRLSSGEATEVVIKVTLSSSLSSDTLIYWLIIQLLSYTLPWYGLSKHVPVQ